MRREKLADFVAIHPQLCADDGDTFFRTLLANKANDELLLFIAGYDPRMQQKMFATAFKESGFNPAHHFAVGIRNMKTDEAINAIKKLIGQNSV